MGDKRIASLGRLARMVLDTELAKLRGAARERDASLAALKTLATPRDAPEGLSPVAAGLAALGYQRWAERQRAEINTRLARQTAEWMEARDRAALAFGRAEALGQLADREKTRKKQR